MRSATAPVLYVKGDLMEQSKAGTKAGRRSRSSVRRKKRADYYDYSLVAVIILLICFGLIMLYSTSSYIAQMNYNDDMFYFKKQALISVGCIVMAIGISMLDYHLLIKLTMPLYGAAIVLMGLVKTSLGHESHGAKRWIQIGSLPQFQPAEVAKIAVIVCLSYMIVQMGKTVKTLKACMVLAGLGGLQGLAAYVLTSNLSTAIIIFCITAGLIFVAHPKTRPFMIGLALIAALAVIGVMILSKTLETSSSFRIRRILVWLHPEDYASGDGYQTLQAHYAIGSGGIFGRGLGNSIQKLGSVPEAQNDMIFSIICEELGLFGALLVLVLFGYLLYRLFFIAQNAPDLFGSLLVTGIFIHIALQVIFNIAVVLNLMPNTGVTLPFISYGGTSIMFLMIEMGLALSVARKIRFLEPEFIM